MRRNLKLINISISSITLILLAYAASALASDSALVDSATESETVLIKTDTGYTMVKVPKKVKVPKPIEPPITHPQPVPTQTPIAVEKPKIEAVQNEIVVAPALVEEPPTPKETLVPQSEVEPTLQPEAAALPVSESEPTPIPASIPEPTPNTSNSENKGTEYTFIVGETEVSSTEPISSSNARNYIGLSAGLLMPNNSKMTDRNGTTADASYSNGFTLSGYAGHAFGNGLRVEGEVSYDMTQLDKFKVLGLENKINSDLWSIGLIANGYLDLPVSKSFILYAVAGLGFKNINISSGTVSGAKLWNQDSAIAFAYQLGVGSGFRINENIILDLSYRYLDTSSFKIDQITTDFSSHKILLGIRYLFNH